VAQINLLKQTETRQELNANLPKIIVRVMLVVLVALVIWYGWLFIELKTAQGQITKAVNQTNSDTQTALTMKDRDQLLTRQQQLQSQKSLISGHTYWSQFFAQLAKVTLKTASYNNLQAAASGDLALSVTVPDLASMDKYMQVFDVPKFNEYFSNLQIDSFNKAQGKVFSTIKFSAKLNFDPKIIQYQAPTN